LRFLPFFDEFELELLDEFELELLDEFELELLEEFELELLDEFPAATATGRSDRGASAADAAGAAPTATIRPVAPSRVAYVVQRRPAPSADDICPPPWRIVDGADPGDAL
jgi:hypothetical protein